jgi:predicted HicB family RNase H-like nuclease
LVTINVNVRFPPDVHGEIARMGVEDGRSLNNEVIAVLREFIARRRKRR